MPQRDRYKALAALAVGVFAISWSAIFVRWTGMPGVASAFYRMLGAALVLSLVLLATGQRLPLVRHRHLLWGALGGLFFAGDVGCYNVAVLKTSAGTATFLGNNAPLLVGLFTWALTKRAPSRRFWTALAIGLCGASLVVGQDRGANAISFRGDLLATLASVCFALYLLVTERLRSTWTALQLTTISASTSAGGLLAFALCTAVPLTIPSISAAFALVGLALVCQIGGYVCLTYALGHLPATLSSVILLAVAPITALLAFALFGERMTRLALGGGALILMAVWVASSRSRPVGNAADLQQTPG